MIQKLLHSLPSKLPVEKAEFDSFCKDIFDTHGFPDKPGYRQMIASMVMHLGPTCTSKSKLHFAKAVKKAQANELAFWVIQETNKEMKAENEKQPEATGKVDETAEPPKA